MGGPGGVTVASNVMVNSINTRWGKGDEVIYSDIKGHMGEGGDNLKCNVTVFLSYEIATRTLLLQKHTTYKSKKSFLENVEKNILFGRPGDGQGPTCHPIGALYK